MSLPSFRYHPDPLSSGSIVPSSATCACCGEARGYVYSGPVYAEDDLEDALCPWCIADGRAHARFEAEFVDSEAFDAEVPAEVVDEISRRTPGFHAWQSEVWPSCCHDAAAFVTPAGAAELQGAFREYAGMVLNHVIYDMGISGGAATRLVDSLHRDRGPTAFLFRCRHCDSPHVHVDHT